MTNCGTFVVRHGMQAGKIASVTAAVIGIVCIYVWEGVQVDNTVKIVLLVLQGGLVASSLLIWYAKDATYYAKASSVIKFVMMVGTLLLLLKPTHG